MTYISNTFPTAIQSATDPIATDQVATFDHAGLETYQNDSIEALKTKVGVDGSAVTTSHDYKLGEVITTDKAVGKSATQTLTNKTLTTPVIAQISNTGLLTLPTSTDTLVGRNTTDTLTNKTLTTPTIGSMANANHNHQNSAGGGTLAESALALTDITTNDATAAKHGFLPKLSGNTSTYLRGDGTFSTISGTTKFGGTGADGALTISSGTTNIDLAGAQIVTKNYTAISITGTGALTFTNSHANGTTIIFKSQGNVTLTSSATPNIDLRYLGGAGGAASHGTGRGGRGAGALSIECAGELNYTGTINASGENFVANSGGISVGNSGGGAGGTVVILTNTITANSGVTNVAVGTTGGSIGGGGGTGAGGNGVDSVGIYGIFKGGAGGSNTNATISTVFGIVPTIDCFASRYIPLMAGSGGGGASAGTGAGATSGVAGTGLGLSGAGVAISGLNTIFQ